MHLKRDKMQKVSVVLLVCLAFLFLFFGAAGAGSELRGAILFPDKYTAAVGDEITWTAHPIGGQSPFQYYYEIYLYQSGSAEGVLIGVRGWDPDNSFEFSPQASGSYRARVYLQDDDGMQAVKLSDAVTVSDPAAPFRILTVIADAQTAAVDDTVQWSVTAEGGTTPYTYDFAVYRNNILSVPADGYDTDSTFSYTLPSAGDYRIRAYVKDDNDLIISMFSSILTVTAAPAAPVEPEVPEFRILSVMPDTWSGLVGYPVSWRIEVVGGTEPYAYAYEAYKVKTGPGDDEQVSRQSYRFGVTNYTFIPSEPGEYYLRVYVYHADMDAADRLTKDSLRVEIESGDPAWWFFF